MYAVSVYAVIDGADHAKHYAVQRLARGVQGAHFLELAVDGLFVRQVYPRRLVQVERLRGRHGVSPVRDGLHKAGASDGVGQRSERLHVDASAFLAAHPVQHVLPDARVAEHLHLLVLPVLSVRRYGVVWWVFHLSILSYASLPHLCIVQRVDPGRAGYRRTAARLYDGIYRPTGCRLMCHGHTAGNRRICLGRSWFSCKLDSQQP